MTETPNQHNKHFLVFQNRGFTVFVNFSNYTFLNYILFDRDNVERIPLSIGPCYVVCLLSMSTCNVILRQNKGQISKGRLTFSCIFHII